MSIIFFISVFGLLMTLPLHIISIKYEILEHKLGKENAERMNKILGHISGDGHFLFCLGIWLAPQPRFYFPVFKKLLTLPVLHYQISLFHLIVSAPLLIAFIVIELLAVKALSMETSVTHKVNKLVHHGIYSIVRHPQHLGHLIGYFGMTLLFSGLWSLIVFPLLFIILMIISYVEDIELLRIFGYQFLKYQKSIPSLIPFTK